MAGPPSCSEDHAAIAVARRNEADNSGMAADLPADPLERLLAEAPEDDEPVTVADAAAIVRLMAQL